MYVHMFMHVCKCVRMYTMIEIERERCMINLRVRVKEGGGGRGELYIPACARVYIRTYIYMCICTYICIHEYAYTCVFCGIEKEGEGEREEKI